MGCHSFSKSFSSLPRNSISSRRLIFHPTVRQFLKCQSTRHKFEQRSKLNDMMVNFSSNSIFTVSNRSRSLCSEVSDSSEKVSDNSIEIMQKEILYSHLIDKVFLPSQSGLLYAFAYGSGVFPQSGEDYNHSRAKVMYPRKNENSFNDKRKLNKDLTPSKVKSAPPVLFSLSSNPMVDIVLVVQDSEAFHQYNLQHNYTHYSFLKYFGSTNLALITDSIGAGLYYNTMIDIQIPFPEDQGMNKEKKRKIPSTPQCR